MNRPGRYALRFTVFTAGVLALSVWTSSEPFTRTPYTSALSALVAAEAVAANTCNKKICLTGTGQCEAQHPGFHCARSGGRCITREYL